MKKIFVLFMIIVVLCSSFCACSGKREMNSRNSGTVQSPCATQDSSAAQKSDAVQDSGTQQSADDSSDSIENGGDLRLLSNRYGDSACNTESGYYYLQEDGIELKDGNYGAPLMYMDFATRREIYLCSTAGCKHNSPDCPAIFLGDDFPSFSTILFIFGDNLYILSREYDNDGSAAVEFIGKTGGTTPAESQPAALYRANLDGTQRQKIYTFDEALTLEDKVIGNDKGIYVITKKLSTEKEGNQTYTTSSERKLMFLDLDSLSLKEICDLDFGDHISWQIIGCHKNGFVLCGTDFGREILRDEKWDDDVYKELYNNSQEVYARLGRNGGKPKEITRQENRYENSVTVLGDLLYLSSSKNQKIEAINIETSEKKMLCKLPQNLILDTLGDTLCCRDWNLADAPAWYFVDTKTGKITHTPLVNLCNGWALDFRGETKSDVLFIYDYDATEDKSDGSYEMHQYKHALISKDDLFAGKDNYRKIKMTGPGR